MRRLRLAIAVVTAFATALLASPAGSQSSSTIAISDSSVAAGTLETFTITRLTGGSGIYVLVQTADGTAKAGVDYTPLHKLFYLKGGTKSVTFTVPTMLNTTATQLTFKVAAAVSSVAVTGTGTIIEPTNTCPDGSVIPLSQTCPTPPPPPANSWVNAPLQDGGFARVVANDSDWDMTGPGNGRVLVPGEIVAVYFNGWGNDADGQTSFAIYALSDGTNGRAKAVDLQGIAPVGTPPGLPSDWWVPGQVTANKTCTDARAAFAGQPGVTQGGVYRASVLAGGHMKLMTGQTGDPSVMWEVFATGQQQFTTPIVVVSGDCLTGN